MRLKQQEGQTFAVMMNRDGQSADTAKSRCTSSAFVNNEISLPVQGHRVSTLDLTSGYGQVTVYPEDRPKTAFITPMGLYEWDRMLFGLCNAPGTFQCLMEVCLVDQNFQTLLTYLDNVFVFSYDFQSHPTNLELGFQRLALHGLELKPTRCHLFQSTVQYLGHMLSEEGVTPVMEKLQAVADRSRPLTVRELRSFFNLVGYHRHFI